MKFLTTGSEASSEERLSFEALASLPMASVSGIISRDLDNDGVDELILTADKKGSLADQGGVAIYRVVADAL